MDLGTMRVKLVMNFSETEREREKEETMKKLRLQSISQVNRYIGRCEIYCYANESSVAGFIIVTKSVTYIYYFLEKGNSASSTVYIVYITCSFASQCAYSNCAWNWHSFYSFKRGFDIILFISVRSSISSQIEYV